MKIKGIVISGKNKGEKIGFPTINIKIDRDLRGEIESGVYAGKVFFDGDSKKAGIFINKDKTLLEAHVLDFSGNLRGKEVEVEVGERLRDIMIFPDDAALIDQIDRDIEKVRNVE